MSNYLNNLAARTLNLTPVVQPRLASLFEPVPVDTGDSERASIESDPRRNGSLSERSTHDRSPVDSKRLKDESSPDEMVSVPRKRGIDLTMSRIGNDAQMRPVDESTPGEVTRTGQRINDQIRPSSLVSEKGRTGVTSLRVPPHESYDNQASASREEAVSDSENGSRRGTMHPTNEVGSLDQASAVDLRNRREIQPAVKVPKRGSLRSIALVSPDSLSMSAARRAFVEPPIADELPPTINVTIGRIDVRAVFSQPSAPRVSHVRQPAAMSLNEYLKQRNEGHR